MKTERWARTTSRDCWKTRCTSNGDPKTQAPPPPRTYRVLHLVGWNIIGIVFVLILGEIALHWLGIEFTIIQTKIQFGAPDPVVLHSQHSVDRHLLWVPNGYSAKVAAWKGRQPTIVFLGDSCTEWGKYPEFLASIMRGRSTKRDFTYVKVGGIGWSSYQGLRQLERDVVPMRPRAVTIYYGWNDHWTNFGLEDKLIGEIYRKHPPLLLELSSRLRMASLVNHAIFAFRYPISKQHSKGSVRVSLSDFSANLRRMISIARDNDILPILLTAPSSHRKGKEPRYLTERRLNDLSDLIPLHQQYVQAVRDIAAQHQAPLIDLYAAFNRLPQEELDGSFQQDGIHLTRKGDEKIAGIIQAYFVDTGLYGRLMELQPEREGVI